MGIRTLEGSVRLIAKNTGMEKKRLFFYFLFEEALLEVRRYFKALEGHVNKTHGEFMGSRGHK